MDLVRTFGHARDVSATVDEAKAKAKQLAFVRFHGGVVEATEVEDKSDGRRAVVKAFKQAAVWEIEVSSLGPPALKRSAENLLKFRH